MNISKCLRFIMLVPIMCVFSILGCASAHSGYVSISAKEAKQLMDTQKDYVIVDVREL